jgi:hypothetical protein
MAKLMKNRTDNDIKNKWYSMMRKEKKAKEKLDIEKHSKAHRARFDLDMPDVEIDNETIYDNMSYEELTQLASEPTAKDAQNMVSFAQGSHGWEDPATPNLAPYPQLVLEGQGSFTMLSDAAASRPVIPCNGTMAGSITGRHPAAFGTALITSTAEPSRADTFGVPHATYLMGSSIHQQPPRRSHYLERANHTMPAATELSVNNRGAPSNGNGSFPTFFGGGVVVSTVATTAAEDNSTAPATHKSTPTTNSYKYTSV